jgi:hypothetical protein
MDRLKEELAEYNRADVEGNLAFRRDHPFWWWFTLVGPIPVALALLALLWVQRGGDFVMQLLGTAVATFFFLGRFVILGGTEPDMADIQSFLTSGELFLMVMYMDVSVACVLAFHLGFLYRIPFIGPRVEALGQDGEFILGSNPWMRHATFFGLTAFVAFPLAATGSVGGAIFGRLLGMSRGATFAGVVMGSLLGCGTMYFGAELINTHLDRDNPWLLVGGVVVIVGIILFLNHRYTRLKQRFLARDPPGG